MSRRKPRASVVRPEPLPRSEPPSGLLGDAEPSAASLGERFRRLALGLTIALIVARGYWPAEFRAEEESGSGLVWSLGLLACLLLAVAAMWLEGGLRLRRSLTDLAVLALFSLVSLSARGAAEGRIAINFAWDWVAVGIGYFLLRNLPRSRRESSALVGALVASAVAVSVYGFYQSQVEFPRDRAEYLKNPGETLRQVLGNANPSPQERKRFEDRLLGSGEIVSTFALANSLAGYLVGPAALGLGVLLRRRRRFEADAEPKSPGRTPLSIALALIPYLVLLACLLLTKSRSAFLGLIVSACVLGWRERGRVSGRTILATAFGLIAVAGLAIGVAAAMGRLDRQVLTQSSMSMRYRLEYWQGTWGVLREGSTWWRGLGPGNFGGPYLRHKLPQASEEIVDPHNLFLEVWAIAGLPALIALVSALVLGLRDLFGPARTVPAVLVDRDEPSEPRSTTWLLLSAGLGGWILVVALGRLNPFEDALTARWLILGGSWLMTAILGRPLWNRVMIEGDLLGLGVLAIVVNLLAAGGIAYPSVALMLWGMLALGMNLREDRPCGIRRPLAGRGLAFVGGGVVAAILGTYFGTVMPFWAAEAEIIAAEAELTRSIARPEEAENHYTNAANADPLGSRAWLGRANLAYVDWIRRGRPPDLTWHRIDSALKKALQPPRNRDSLLVHRLRARMASDFLKVDGLIPQEKERIRDDRIDSSFLARVLYPTDATIRADLAEALADGGLFTRAAAQSYMALKLDRETPHNDKRLTPEKRELLLKEFPIWLYRGLFAP